MLSRWYSLFLGFLLIVLGIAGLVVGSQMHVMRGGLVATSIIWLIIALASLYVGFGVRNLLTVRWFAGTVGAILFVWGIIQMIASPAAVYMGVAAALASVGGFLVLLGAFGLAAALVPAIWLRELTTVPTA